MNLFHVLERCRENAEKWGWEHNKTCGGPKDEAWRLSKESWQDWRTLEAEILASIDEHGSGHDHAPGQTGGDGSPPVQAVPRI